MVSREEQGLDLRTGPDLRPPCQKLRRSTPLACSKDPDAHLSGASQVCAEHPSSLRAYTSAAVGPWKLWQVVQTLTCCSSWSWTLSETQFPHLWMKSLGEMSSRALPRDLVFCALEDPGMEKC